MLLCIPSLTLAAGFAKQSMFLSQSSVAEGNTVLIYAVVENDSATSFTGALKFADQMGSIGSVPVSLAAGQAATVSVSWKPVVGPHAVVANLTTLTGQTVESDKASFVVHPAPPHSQVSTTTAMNDLVLNELSRPKDQTVSIQTSDALEQWIAHVAPPVANITAPVFSAVDSGRLAGAKKLGAGGTWAQDALSKAAVAPGGWLNTLWLISMTILLYLCSTLGYVLKNLGIFYPVIAFIFFYILWRIYKLMRRDKYSY